MAAETLAPAAAAAAAEVVVSPPPAPAAEKPAAVLDSTPPSADEPEKSSAAAETPAATDAPAAETDDAVAQSTSFKEESNKVADLIDPEKKALEEFKQLIQAALANNEFAAPPPPPPPAAKVEEPAAEAAAAEPPKPTEEPVAAITEEAVKVEAAEPAPPAAAEVAVPPAATEKPAAEVAVPPAATEKPAAEVAVPPATPEEPAAVSEEKVVIEETLVPVVSPPPPAEEVTAAEPEAPLPPPEEIFIWGVPLLGDEKSDTVLLKFLRARDFKVKEAFALINHAVVWRKQFGIEELLSEDLGVTPELEKVVFMHGQDKEGHPVCYNVYGEFQDKELYSKAFGDEEKRSKFLKWRIQFLEKGIRELLDFTPTGVSTMVQVTDLKNVAGPGKRELRQATKQALTLLQDSYPEFVAKQIFINVPWWYLAYNRVISSVFTPRSKSKFVFAGPSRSTETLFKYIAPEHVPVQYGGLSKDDSDFTTADAGTDVTIKPASKHTIEIEATEGSLLVWELRVLGWEVSYGAEFVPSTEGNYTVIIAKTRKFAATDEPLVKNSFKISEAGKVVLTIDNATSKKKKVLYRSKVKTGTE